jgi:hypothetical protein
VEKVAGAGTVSAATDVKLRVRVQPRRQVQSVSLLHAPQNPKWELRESWVELPVPRVDVYEAVQVELR